jgi:hypothetical protein
LEQVELLMHLGSIQFSVQSHQLAVETAAATPVNLQDQVVQAVAVNTIMERQLVQLLHRVKATTVDKCLEVQQIDQAAAVAVQMQSVQMRHQVLPVMVEMELRHPSQELRSRMQAAAVAVNTTQPHHQLQDQVVQAVAEEVELQTLLVLGFLQ